MSARVSRARDRGRRAVLVSSLDAGSAINPEQLAAWLGRVGVTVAHSLLVSDLDHSRPQGMHWREQGYDLVIAAGGDGTIGSVATHIAESGLPLAILPMGTANDVARSLHLPLDVEEACVAIAGAAAMDIDIGQVMPALTEPLAYSTEHKAMALAGAQSPVAGVRFVHAVTLGLNVEFARLATDSLRRQRLGRLTYAASALEAVAHYRPIDVTLSVFAMEGEDEAAEQIIHSHAVQVVIFNTPVVGGWMDVRVPDISVRDRQLDFMIIEAVDAQQLRHTVQQLLAALDGESDASSASDASDRVSVAEQRYEAPHLPGVRRFRAKAAVIETAEGMDVTLDGEIRTHTPIFVRVASEQLRVLVPPQAKLLLMQDRPPSEPGAATS
jgi:diacylglycerol kinase (ATP)